MKRGLIAMCLTASLLVACAGTDVDGEPSTGPQIDNGTIDSADQPNATVSDSDQPESDEPDESDTDRAEADLPDIDMPERTPDSEHVAAAALRGDISDKTAEVRVALQDATGTLGS